jgi:hypothetical protein
MTTVLADRLAWSRRNVAHHYVGTLVADESRVTLAGREPATGIEVTLSIPAGEIEAIRVSGCEEERLVGDDTVVIELVDSEPIVLREIGPRKARPRQLAASLGLAVLLMYPIPPI